MAEKKLPSQNDCMKLVFRIFGTIMSSKRFFSADIWATFYFQFIDRLHAPEIPSKWCNLPIFLYMGLYIKCALSFWSLESIIVFFVGRNFPYAQNVSYKFGNIIIFWMTVNDIDVTVNAAVFVWFVVFFPRFRIFVIDCSIQFFNFSIHSTL